MPYRDGNPLHEQPMSPEQSRFLVALHQQRGMTPDLEELSKLSKWEAALLVNRLRGTGSGTEQELESMADELMRAVQENVRATPEPQIDTETGEIVQPARRRPSRSS